MRKERTRVDFVENWAVFFPYCARKSDWKQGGTANPRTGLLRGDCVRKDERWASGKPSWFEGKIFRRVRGIFFWCGSGNVRKDLGKKKPPAQEEGGNLLGRRKNFFCFVCMEGKDYHTDLENSNDFSECWLILLLLIPSWNSERTSHTVCCSYI